jgi:hypothetical protein
MARIEAVLGTCVYACSRIEIGTKCELHLVTLTLIEEYLEAAGHRQDPNAPLTRPVKKNMRAHILTALAPDSLYFDGGAEVSEQAWYFRGKHGAARDAGARPRPMCWIMGADICEGAGVAGGCQHFNHADL